MEENLITKNFDANKKVVATIKQKQGMPRHFLLLLDEKTSQ